MNGVNQRPIQGVSTLDTFDDDTWELHDGAEKLIEATRYNVLPLDDRHDHLVHPGQLVHLMAKGLRQ